MYLRPITCLALGLFAVPVLAETVQRSSTEAMTIYQGAIEDADWGRPVASGDFDGDGYNEVVVGASPFVGGISHVYVMRGGPTAHVRGTVDLYTTGADLDIIGAQADDTLGTSIATGDVNGDGIDDLLMCASLGDPPGRNAAGIAYLLYGGPNFFANPTRNLATPGSWDVRIYGATANGDMGGSNLFGGLDAHGAAIGNLNGDQYGDIALGIHLATGGAAQSGVVYVKFGAAFFSGITLDLASPAGQNVRINGRSNTDELGTYVLTGDITGDGIDELILGNEYYSRGVFTSEGAVHIFRGQVSWSTVYNLSALAPITLWGGRADDGLGGSVAVGDFDGDGVLDLASAADGAELGALNSQRGDGLVYGLRGGSHLQTGSILIAYATATPAFLIVGESQQNFGRELTAGDFNADGVDDIAGAEWFSGPSVNGSVDVLFGRHFVGSPVFHVGVDTDLHILGQPQDRISFSLGTSNVNGDDRDEILFGTPFNNGPIGLEKGTVYVFTHVPEALDSDLDNNGITNGVDYTVFLDSFGTSTGDEEFNPTADFDGNGQINWIDFQIWLEKYRAIGDTFAQAPAAGSGDVDGDGGFTAAELDTWSLCQSAPGVAPASTVPSANGCLYLFDVDKDNDVDLSDFARLQTQQASRGGAAAPAAASAVSMR
jgi:hypothetical protein